MDNLDSFIHDNYSQLFLKAFLACYVQHHPEILLQRINNTNGALCQAEEAIKPLLTGDILSPDTSFTYEAAQQILSALKNNFDPDNFKVQNQHECNISPNGIRKPFDAKHLLQTGCTNVDKLFNAIVSTNFFLQNQNDYVSFKLMHIEPKIHAEIFVYSKDFEACHIRAGKVARGGIRWSDRNDYRVEVLDLVDAQILKNTIIVPTGSKGAFRIHNNGQNDKNMGLKCYQTFLMGLLDITDIHPEDLSHQHHDLNSASQAPSSKLIKYHQYDPYFVVAADKGTASFSDAANQISHQYNYWLGDAFASGGSNGYSHKDIGITSLGCLESVKRHLKALGKSLDNNTDANPISVVGIGDMSGDVFGNALLTSDKYQLIAAFNHKFIFIDPSPDPKESFALRQQLFAEQSNWDKYPQVNGAKVYDRYAEKIELSVEEAKLLEVDTIVTPNDLIKAILTAKVDIIWNGGIGTYVKAECESHADANDSSNDCVRINGKDIKAKIIAEGGNLGVTQLGRIEASITGVNLNTDFIDNSGGVNCSDFEVNIKIWLHHLKVPSEIAKTIIASLQPDVVQHVLANNKAQNDALDLYQSKDHDGSQYLSLAEMLVKNKVLDQSILDNYWAFQHKYSNNTPTNNQDNINLRAFTRPELCMLLSGSKIHLNRIITAWLETNDLSREYLESALNAYYPSKIFNLIDQYCKSIGKNFDLLDNPLVKSIAITIIVNQTLNNNCPSELFNALDNSQISVQDICNQALINQKH